MQATKYQYMKILKYFKRFPSARGQVSISEDFRWPAAFYCLPIVASPTVGIIKFVVYLFLLVVQVDIYFDDTISLSKKEF